MFYKTIQDLPDEIKQVMPDAAQTVFMGEFNRVAKASEAYGDDLKDDDIKLVSKIAFAAVERAGFKKGDAGKYSKPSDNNHSFDAEIFAAGTYPGRGSWDVKDIDDIVTSFSALRGAIKPPLKAAKPPLKMGHNTEQEKTLLRDGQPALGWVTGLKRVGEKLIASFSNVPKVVAEAIKSKRFMRVSSEIVRGFKHDGKTFGNVLYGVALLGQDVPVVKNLEDLRVLLSDHDSDELFSASHAFSYDIADGEGENIQINYSKNVEGITMTPEEIKALEKKAADAEAENARLKADNEAQEAKFAEFEAKHAEKAEADRVDVFKAFCEDAVKDGKMAPSGRDAIVKVLDKHNFSEDGEVAISLETFESFVKTQTSVMEFTESAHDDGKGGEEKLSDPGAELTRLSTAYMSEHNVDYMAASKAVLAANPVLAKAYSGK